MSDQLPDDTSGRGKTLLSPADAPIRSLGEDRLGRELFARTLAAEVLSIPVVRGYAPPSKQIYPTPEPPANRLCDSESNTSGCPQGTQTKRTWSRSGRALRCEADVRTKQLRWDQNWLNISGIWTQ